ncbi:MULTISPECIES: M56 family metallopeptidase [Proteiniphilum]|uniref:M56 family metallopeptidase n=1 Tax=Proteiniphilum TaxID=294702 RepID=UPI001EECABAA|nr:MULTISPECIES: M56 family metallopeptidase [Proteiniphilum]
MRRIFFLSAILFSLLYPLFVIPAFGEMWNFRSNSLEKVNSTVIFEKPAMVLATEEPTSLPSFAISWEQVLTAIFGVGTLFFVLRFFWQLISIMRIRLNCEKSMISGIAVYQLKYDMPPFSFFKLIFIHTEKHSETEIAQILLHEHTHVRQWHSLDIILIEIFFLFSWWNPCVWLMKREMAMNLEYLADNGVLREGVDSREYQFHLLRLTYHETAVQIVNNFNVSQLKQRIMMMNKTKSPMVKLAKYIASLPLALLLITANSVYAQQAEPQKRISATDEVFVVVEIQPEFPGGTEAMMRFLIDNIRYPEEAKTKGIEGRVICNFIVMKDGSIADVNVVRGIDPLLDAEAVRVLESMPEWEPGKQRGQAVNVRFTIPVVFRLSRNESSDLKAVCVKADSSQEQAFVKFIAQNIKYPVIAQENGITGLVKTSYSVSDKGEITNLKIAEGVDPSLDSEVLRVLKMIPSDIVLEKEGGRANSKVDLTVYFRLQDEELSNSGSSSVVSDIVVVGYGVKKTPEIKDPR